MNAFWDMLASASLQRLAWTLLHSVWQFAMMAVLLSAVLTAMRRRSAEARYLTACIGLVVMMSTSIGTYWWLAASRTAESVVTTAVDEGKTRFEPANSITVFVMAVAFLPPTARPRAAVWASGQSSRELPLCWSIKSEPV